MKTISISLANENRVERNLYAQRWAAWNAKTKKSGIEIPYCAVCRTDKKIEKTQDQLFQKIDVQLIAGRSIIVE